MSMEIMVQPLNLSAVSFNKDEMKAAVAVINERYANIVVTDKAEAKKDRAEVNKLLKQIDDVRKSVKKQYEAPMKAFEADIKEIVEPLKASGEAIDRQIKAIEEQERQEKLEQIREQYNGGILGIPFDMVFDPKYLNASVSVKKAIDEMTVTATAKHDDIDAIEALCSPHYPALIRRYMDGASLAEVLAYDAELKRIKAEQEAKSAAQTFTIAVEPTAAETAAQLEAEDPRNDYAVTDDGILVTAKTSTHKLMITCTDRQYEELAAYLDRMGLFYIEQ